MIDLSKKKVSSVAEVLRRIQEYTTAYTEVIKTIPHIDGEIVFLTSNKSHKKFQEYEYLPGNLRYLESPEILNDMYISDIRFLKNCDYSRVSLKKPMGWGTELSLILPKIIFDASFKIDKKSIKKTIHKGIREILLKAKEEREEKLKDNIKFINSLNETLEFYADNTSS